jgi:hypothetical protein
MVSESRLVPPNLTLTSSSRSSSLTVCYQQLNVPEPHPPPAFQLHPRPRPASELHPHPRPAPAAKLLV